MCYLLLSPVTTHIPTALYLNLHSYVKRPNIVYIKTIIKSYINNDHENERDVKRKRNQSQRNKRQCVYDTHDTNTSNTFQINQQQQA